MEQNFYIPGDLVMTNGRPKGTAKGVVYRVTATGPNKTLKLNDGTILKGTVCLENIEGTEIGDKGYLMCECCAWVKDIVPLKLSSEILERNGWKLTVKDVNRVNIYHKNGLRIDESVYTGTLCFICNDISVRLGYVSDLQHLLFGLDINSEMEV